MCVHGFLVSQYLNKNSINNVESIYRLRMSYPYRFVLYVYSILQSNLQFSGNFQGQFEKYVASELGSIVIAEALVRAKVKPADVDQCIMGQVFTYILYVCHITVSQHCNNS